MTDPIADALAEIKRRATHFDSTGYITVHEDELREALVPLCEVVRAARAFCGESRNCLPCKGREAAIVAYDAAALSATPSQEPTE